MQAKRCEFCKFWVSEDMNDQSIKIGKCLRYPPTLDTNRVKRLVYKHDELKKLGLSVHYDFPFTVQSQWCGEFNAKI